MAGSKHSTAHSLCGAAPVNDSIGGSALGQNIAAQRIAVSNKAPCCAVRMCCNLTHGLHTDEWIECRR